VRDVRFSPSGRHIASAALDGEVRLWSALNGSPIATITGHSLPINRISFSQSGQELVTVSDDSTVKVLSYLTAFSLKPDINSAIMFRHRVWSTAASSWSLPTPVIAASYSTTLISVVSRCSSRQPHHLTLSMSEAASWLVLLQFKD
jgi:WD40 repeat protein